MVSEKKLQANRQNAQKSTGPKTKEGKERSSQNATTHGLFCSSLLLPHDPPLLFHALRDSYLLSLKPQNLPELQLVDQIVAAVWRLRRVQDAESFLHHDSRATFVQTRHITSAPDSEAVSTLATAHAYSDDQIEAKLDRLARHEQRHQRTIHRCYHELRLLRKDPLEELPPCPYYDHPNQVFHLNPNDIPQDESQWPEFNPDSADTNAQDDQNQATDPEAPPTNSQGQVTSDQGPVTKDQ